MSNPKHANSARRNRAQRKILNCKSLDIEIRTAIAVIIDHLSHRSNYSLAWPSAQHIANKLGRSRRSAQWYIRIIKRLEIFTWKQLSPAQAVAYVQQKYGFQIKLDRCAHQAPNLFEVNTDHPLWNGKTKLSLDIEREMQATAEAVKELRNRKTTSRLSSSSGKRPNKFGKYDVVAIRKKLRVQQRQTSNGILEIIDSDVASFTTSGVANVIQVSEFSFGCSPNENPDAEPAFP